MASSSVFLNVNDIERSLAFYRALGFRVAAKHKNDAGEVWWADLSLGKAELGLGAIAANKDPEYRAWVATPLGAGVVVYFEVRDVDAVHARAKEAKAVIEHPPQDRSYGRALTINDPDGYVLAFLGPLRKRKAPARKRTAAKPRSVKRRR